MFKGVNYAEDKMSEMDALELIATLAEESNRLEALAASRLRSLNVWKEAAKEKRWRLVLCTEAAASRLKLLRRGIKPMNSAVYKIWLEDVAEELGDD